LLNAKNNCFKNATNLRNKNIRLAKNICLYIATIYKKQKIAKKSKKILFGQAPTIKNFYSIPLQYTKKFYSF